MLASLMIALAATLIIELMVFCCIGVRSKQDFKILILANICTNPPVVYITNLILLCNNIKLYVFAVFVLEVSAVIVLEVSAVIVEYLIYKKQLSFNKIKPLTVSIICNIASFGIGIILF